jgi:tripartite-type tricarboxylate transporter receptor subunit TctC
MKVLAVTGTKRIPQLPDVPSWQEEGVPNANVINYWGIVAPVGTPAASSPGSTRKHARSWRSPTFANGSNAKAQKSSRVRRSDSAR